MAPGPASRSGSMGFNTGPSGPSASGGIAWVSSRQCTASAPSRSSTRNESNVLRTDQSRPLPIRAATSLGERTTESGPLGCFRRSALVWLLASDLGVGAPTAVSVTGGSAVRRGPSQREAVRRSGSRNHQATSPAPRTSARQPSRRTPLRQPFTVPHLIHRAPRLEHTLHRSEEHTSELQSLAYLVCRLLLEKKK